MGCNESKGQGQDSGKTLQGGAGLSKNKDNTKNQN